MTPEKIAEGARGDRPRPGRRGPDRPCSPRSPGPRRCAVAPPWEGGDGTRQQRSPGARSRNDDAAEARDRRCGHDAAAALRLSRAARRSTRPRRCSPRAPGDAMLLAGGTDLLPNMKRRQQMPRTLVGLRGVARAARASTQRRRSRIGAGVTLTELVRDDARARARCPGLWQAAAQIATPHLRNMGTHRRQPLPRHALQLLRPELRVAQGDRLLHEEGRRRPAGSRRRARSAWRSRRPTPRRCCRRSARACGWSRRRGEREVAVADLYHNDGMHYLTRRPDEILADDRGARVGPGWRSTYWKLRRRGVVRLPGAVGGRGGAARRGRHASQTARVVLGAVASRPLAAPQAEALLVGQHAHRRARSPTPPTRAYDVGEADGQHRLRAGAGASG